MIRLADVSMAVGGTLLAEGIDLHIRPGDRIGLVGRNGTGKSTLLRTLLGELSPWTGQVHIRGGLRLGWLPQQAVAGSTLTVWQEAASAMTALNALADALSAAEAACVAQAPGAPERLAEATERFELAGGFRRDERIGEVLRGLGFGPDRWHLACETFSGGWQMRIALAKLLLSDPELALLDEPTNHLDVSARSWLAGYLARANFALLVVSHDHHLLNAVVNRVAELQHGRLEMYNLPYGKFLAERDARRLAQAAAHARQADEIAKLERYVERFGAKASKATQAKSKQKALDRMERIDAPVRDEAAPRVRLPPAPAAAHDAVGLEKVTLGWPDGPVVLTDVRFTLSRGMRVAVLGPNGAGKSTLLHALSGKLAVRAGRRTLGDRVRIGLFTQDLAAELPPDQTPFQVVEAAVPTEPPQRIRGVLGALGLSGEDALRPVDQLSGGERARVALARLCIRAHDVLLLDEPSNHLDAATVAVLAEALSNFDGALLLVSHDRWLVERVATHTLRVHNGTATLKVGLDATDFDFNAQPDGQAAPPSEAAVSHAERKRMQRDLERNRKRIADIEARLEKIDGLQDAANKGLAAVGDDWSKAKVFADEQAKLTEESEALFAEWEALEAACALLA